MLRGWYTVAYQPENQPKWDDIRREIEDRSDPTKQADALHRLVLLSYSEQIPNHLYMPVIQYMGTTTDHRSTKLLFMFLENLETRNAQGKLRDEFILIIDAIRKRLLSDNEYIRVAAMRFLQKVNDPDVIVQLIPSLCSYFSWSSRS